jgi:hypothetical protein
MITKKLDNQTFAWDPNAFKGKGYWYVIGKKGGLGRAASKDEFKQLGKPKEEESIPASPEVVTEPQQTETDKSEVKEDKNKKEPHEYEKASLIRKKGLGNLISEKLVEGQGIGASIKGGVSERMKATMTGLKEKTDPMNIAKKLTGGSKLGPALVGKMMGRKQEDMEYFTGLKNKKEESKTDKTEPSIVDKKKPKSTKMKRSDTSGATEIVIELYELLKKDYEERKLGRELDRDFAKEKKAEAERRHAELIKSISGMTLGGGTVTSEKEGGGGIFDFIKNIIFGKIKDMVLAVLESTGVLALVAKAKGAAKAAIQAIKGGAGAAAKTAGTVAKAAKVSKLLTAAKGVLEFLNKVPGLSLIASGAALIADVASAIQRHEAGEITDQAMKKEIVEAVGGAAGGVGGAELGGMLGAALGSAVPGLGTLIGGLTGGVAGFFGGEKLGKYAAGKLFDYMNGDEKEIPKKSDKAAEAAPASKETQAPAAAPASTPKTEQAPAAKSTASPMPSGNSGASSTPPQQAPAAKASPMPASTTPPPPPVTPKNNTGEKVDKISTENADANASPVVMQPVVTNNTKISAGQDDNKTSVIGSTAVRNDDESLIRTLRGYARPV